MRLKVSDILARETGSRTSFQIAGERPELDDAKLASDLSGEITLTRTDDGLLVNGSLSTSLELECHRCLRAFAFPTTAKLEGEFTEQPTEDQWPIEEDSTIDLGPLVRQELLVTIPIKQLCKPDCLGLCDVCGLPQDEKHDHKEGKK
jgi:uncharacterized protein